MALVLAAMMLLSVVAMADSPSPAGTWTGTLDAPITITGLATGDTVNFYQVLAYDQNATTTGGWSKTTAFTTLTPDNVNQILGLGDYATGATKAAQAGISAELAGTIAKLATGTAEYSGVTADATGTATVATPAAGLYVAIITPAAAGTIYNPVFVGADYYTENPESKTWAVTTAISYADSAMAKKTTIDLVKEATEKTPTANENDGTTATNAREAGVGDVINYTVKTTIPEFADNYTAPLFVLTDALSDGLTLDQNSIKVYAATVSEGTWTKGSEITATVDGDPDDVTQFTISDKSASGYKITFDPDYLLSLGAAQPIIVEYSAEITEAAYTNINEEDNTVTLEYSHKPDVTSEGNGTKLRDKTHHYTFTIDGVIWGDSEYKTTEVVKVGLDKNGNEITQTVDMHSGKKIGALEGAEFKLYTNSACTEAYEYKKGDFAPDGLTIVSDAEGRLKVQGASTPGIRGLDAGTYYLKETKAPDGYIKQQDATKIEITTEYYGEVTWNDADGVEVKSDDLMKSYTVKIDDATTATYTIQYKDAFVDSKPANDTFAGDIANMKGTSEGDIVIGNSGPITTVQAESDAADVYGKIQNTQGVELPSTGGIGTTIFYVAGSILVLAAAILLITKRRMGAND